MANAQRGGIAIELDGASYDLLPDFKAIAAIEQRTGKGIMEIADVYMNVGYGLHVTAIVIEECMRSADQTIPKTLGEMLRRNGIAKLSKPLMQLMHAAINGDAPPREAEATPGEPVAAP